MRTGDRETRQTIAGQLTRRCTNCFCELPGYQVNGRGWHWIEGDVGPFCDDCWTLVVAWLSKRVTEAIGRTINDLTGGRV